MDENQETTIQQKGTSPLLVVGVIVVVVIIVGAFWLTNSQSKNIQNTQKTVQTQETVTAPSEAMMEKSSEDSMMTKIIEVEGGNFYFKPNEIRVKRGEKVTIVFKSAGGMHDFVIDEFNVRSETISRGSTTVEFVPDKSGTFEFYCAIANHRQMGMKGKLIVE